MLLYIYRHVVVVVAANFYGCRKTAISLVPRDYK